MTTFPFQSRAEESNRLLWVYLGTASPQSKGIYVSQMDLTTGKLTKPEIAGEVTRPSFLAIHPHKQFIYATCQINDSKGQKISGISAFSIDPQTAKLTLLNELFSGGPGACHLNVDPDGKSVLVANYQGGSVSVLSLEQDGRLGKSTAFIQHQGSSVHPKRQEQAHAHSINLDPSNRFALVADLGMDKILIYSFDALKGSLTANEPPFVSVRSGAGPRHLTFHPNGKWLYLINELDSTMTRYEYESHGGKLETKESVPMLPEGFKEENTCAEVAVHPSGRFLYGSNRGHDSITGFSIDSLTGKLTFIEHQSTQGSFPRHFGITPDGSFLIVANQKSDNLVVYRIDVETGRLKPTGQILEVPAPTCVKFLSH